MRRVVISGKAAEDLEAGRDFYETQATGLGEYFKDSLIADIESLVLASRFPFGIYYLETEAETQVAAILDLRSDPSWLHRELAQRNS